MPNEEVRSHPMGDTLLWMVGLNMPGYLPESEPSAHEAWADARDALVAELEHSAEVAAQALSAEADPATGFESAEAEAEIVLLDVAIERVKALPEGQPYGQTIGRFHYWLARGE